MDDLTGAEQVRQESEMSTDHRDVWSIITHREGQAKAINVGTLAGMFG